MKTLLSRRLLVGLLLVGFMVADVDDVLAHPPPPPIATTNTVTWGTNNYSIVTPALLAYALSGVSIQVNYTNQVLVQSNLFVYQTNFVSYLFVTNTSVFNGKVSIASNLYLTTVSFRTNSHPSESVISLTNSWPFLATNNNTFFDNLAGIEVGSTNVQTVMLTLTNTSAAAKTITMHARFQNMNASEGNTLYLTNYGQLLVFLYPYGGTVGPTNFYFKSR